MHSRRHAHTYTKNCAIEGGATSLRMQLHVPLPLSAFLDRTTHRGNMAWILLLVGLVALPTSAGEYTPSFVDPVLAIIVS